MSSKLTWGLGFLATVWLVGGTACLEPSTPGVCSADIVAAVDSLELATSELIDAATALKVDVGTACARIATDLGETGVPTITADSSDDDVALACQLAQDAIDAALAGGIEFTVLVEGGYCEVDAQAQIDCEASCEIEGECDPGSVETRCDPGYLSVVCDGECEAGAYCQGTAEVAANCTGSCSGACTGDCMGTPVEGAYCDGTCTGTCTGECYLDADVNVECGAEVRCRGGCTVEGELPRCETEIEPPECNIDADCQAGCQGEASFNAECYPPRVVVVATGGVDPETFITTLETNLPAIVDAIQYYGPIIVDQATVVADRASAALAAANSNALCNLIVAGNVGVEFAAATTASVSVTATVSVSVEVGATVGVQ